MSRRSAVVAPASERHAPAGRSAAWFGVGGHRRRRDHAHNPNDASGCLPRSGVESRNAEVALCGATLPLAAFAAVSDDLREVRSQYGPAPSRTEQIDMRPVDHLPEAATYSRPSTCAT